MGHKGSEGLRQVTEHAADDLALADAESEGVRSLARKQTDKSLIALAEIRDNTDAPAGARRSAARDLLEFGWGKPSQMVIHRGDSDGSGVQIFILRLSGEAEHVRTIDVTQRSKELPSEIASGVSARVHRGETSRPEGPGDDGLGDGGGVAEHDDWGGPL